MVLGSYPRTYIENFIFQPLKFFRNLNREIVLWIKLLLHFPRIIEHLYFNKPLDYLISSSLSFLWIKCLVTAVPVPNNINYEIWCYETKLHSTIFFIFNLKHLCKWLIAIVHYNGQYVERIVSNTFAILIHRNAKSTSDCLTLFPKTLRCSQGADLKDVRAVPAFTKRRMRKDEVCWFFKREQTLFILHNQVVCIGVLVFAFRIYKTLFVLREIAFVHILDRDLWNPKVFILGTWSPLFETFFKPEGYLALNRRVEWRSAIIGNFVNKEERKDLYSEVSVGLLLLEVRLHR